MQVDELVLVNFELIIIRSLDYSKIQYASNEMVTISENPVVISSIKRQLYLIWVACGVLQDYNLVMHG